MRCSSLRAILASVIIASTAFATTHTINVQNNSFSPSSVTIVHGDTVQWIQKNGLHTTTSDPTSPKDWDSGNLTTNVPFKVVFLAADGNGPFPFHCDNHSFMHGTINVQSLDVKVEQTTVLPSAFTVAQNFPNPFNPTTSIGFSLERQANVRFAVFNILGETVESRDLGMLNAGTYSVEWSAQNAGSALPSGIYFYRIEAGELAVTRKMVLLK